ncbi:MAG: hypothetical protein AAFQ19_09840 [Pseudomonadota bacterium]
MIRYIAPALTTLALAASAQAQDTNTDGALLGGSLTEQVAAIAAGTAIVLIVLSGDGSDGTTTTTTTSP